MTAEQFIKARLAALAYEEAAHHGGIDNMLAVAFVMRNRKLAGWQGGDWMRIIDAAPQSAGTFYPKPESFNLRDLNFRNLLAQVDDIVNGMALDPMTDGALFYAELHNTTEWFRNSVLAQPEQHKRVAQVGQVTFFT